MLSQFFKLNAHGVTVRSEVFAGFSTFLTMAFIIAVNPAILSDAGIDFGAAFVATILATILGTLIMGVYAGWPVACLLYTSPSPRDGLLSRMPSSA